VRSCAESAGRRLEAYSRRVVTITAAVLSVGVFSASASAHSFLIRSQPEAGSRLAKAPRTMTLGFSEPFVAGSQRVELVRANGHVVELSRSRGRGSVIDQPLPANLRGVFIVSWRVVSIDGHVSLGEFAFAAGSAGALPNVASASQPTSWSEVAASWLVFIGLALALGGLVSERVVWRPAPAPERIRAAPVVAGAILGAAGGLLELVLLAGNERGGGLTSGLNAGALGNAFATRPGKLTLAILIALAAAGVLARVRPLRTTAIVPLLAAVVFNADLGHSGTSSTGWAVVADSVHLAAVATWAGALAHLVVIAGRAEERRPAFIAGARRYSRFALPTVLVILATGVLTAIPEFRSVGEVVSTGYGRTLLIKSALIGVALLLALTARLRALPENPYPRLAVLRRLTMAEATMVLAVLIAAAVLVNAAPPRAPTAAQASTALLGPPPVAGPTLRLADLAGQLVVGLTAGARELQFTVFPPAYQAPGDLSLTAQAREPDGSSRNLFPRPCGNGCFAIGFPLRRGVTVVTAYASSSKWTGGHVRFAIPWPVGPEQPVVIRRVVNAVQALRSLTFTERVTIAYGSPQPPTIQSMSGHRFMQLDPLGAGGEDVRPLSTQSGLREFAFIYTLGGSNIWYRIWVDRSYRLRRELIVGEQGRLFRTFRVRR
jgi:copper transport protein